MHDMGIELHHHVLIDLDTADPGNPSQIISSQVDEHDMFGPFLGVLKELVGKDSVLLFVLSPSSRPGNGP